MKKVVCFGEVLWDVFPEGKKAGGAPMNVAFRLKSLGHDVHMISKVGNDDLGMELLEIIEGKISSKYIQIEQEIPTGIVSVKLDENRNATYDIVFPSAWDFVEINDVYENLVEDSDVFIFGSLACRNEVSRETLLKLLQKATFSVFDVNLRAPHYDLDFVLELMKKSNLVKMNEEELVIFSKYLNLNTENFEEIILKLSEITDTKTFCVTCGKDGAIYFSDGKFFTHEGFSVKVQDTVGAGDSFLGALIHKIFIEETPAKTLEFASAVGAIVASEVGPTPEISEERIKDFIKDSKKHLV